MCGLFGIAGNGIVQKDLKALHDLGVISQLRGVDGFGCYQRGASDTGLVGKTVKPLQSGWYQLKERHKKYKFLDTIVARLYMCHVRAATKGVISSANSHPFISGHMVVAHNGTLTDKKYEDPIRADSMLMTADVAKRGLKAVLEDLNPESAFAVTVWDEAEDTLTFARNDKRTLFFYHCADRAVVYWASERRMLDFVFDRHEIKKGPESTFHPGKMYTLSLNGIKRNDGAIWDIEDVKLRVPEKKKSQIFNRSYAGHNNNNGGHKNKAKGKSIIPKINKNDSVRKENVKEIQGKVEKVKGDVPPWVINNYYDKCQKCGKDMSLEESNLCTPLLDGEVVCDECWTKELKKRNVLN